MSKIENILHIFTFFRTLQSNQLNALFTIHFFSYIGCVSAVSFAVCSTLIQIPYLMPNKYLSNMTHIHMFPKYFFVFIIV